MIEKLFFNGVNAASGRYGLAPMTVEEFADHLLGDWSETLREIRDLRRDLARRTANERKILDIVDFLVADIVRLLSRIDATDRDWYVDAASRLLAVLLGGADAVGPGDVVLLAERLRRDPREVLVRVVQLLNAGQGSALAEWLLGQDEGRGVSLQGNPLRSSLEARFDQALVAIQKTYLNEATILSYDEGERLNPAWIEGFVQALAQLPVASLCAISSSDIVAAAHRRLTYDLDQSADLHDTHGRIHPQLRSAWVALFAAEAAQSWSALGERLHDLLVAVRQAELVMTADSLRRAFGGWLDELRRQVTGHLGVVPWVDPRELAQAGWGIVFPARLPEARCEALQRALAPLLDRRRSQAGERFFIFADHEGYRPGDSVNAFLGRAPRSATMSHPADPRTTGVPYYLLLIGSPDEIPFEFQYQLDVQYAVGRLDFGDDMAAYASYARNVVAAEQPDVVPSSQVVFFATEHPGDEATQLSAHHLVEPLVRHFKEHEARLGCRVLQVDPAKASKRNLIKLLQLDPPPALLFAATHGLEFDCGHPDQPQRQGALICQDWQGDPGEVPQGSYLSADDVTEAMNLRGMVLFFFACYGAGTPQVNDYYRREFRTTARAIADAPFVAGLPRAMLALRDRGALAVVGHVDRAWGLSFLSDTRRHSNSRTAQGSENVEVFAATLDWLLTGYPVGAALDFFNMRYAAVATELTHLFQRIAEPPSLADTYRLAELWTANNDARGYVVLGDPAVRIRRTPSASIRSV